ncbi:MAG: hypothetical protein PVG81_14610, partial [Desulfobacterales bacterium]
FIMIFNKKTICSEKSVPVASICWVEGHAPSTCIPLTHKELSGRFQLFKTIEQGIVSFCGGSGCTPDCKCLYYKV